MTDRANYQPVFEAWKAMPEYDNVDQTKVAKQVTFKFETEAHYDEFISRFQAEFFDGHRVFNGRQKKDSKTGWWPRREKDSNWEYVDES